MTIRFKMIGLGMLIIFVSLGLGRFTFGSLLPFIKQSEKFSYIEIGVVASGLFLGYIVSTFFSGRIVGRYGHKRVMETAHLSMTVGFFILAWSPSFFVMLFSTLLIGASTGCIVVPLSAYIPRFFERKEKGKILGIIYMGSSFGMLFAAYFVPWVVQVEWLWGWKTLLYIAVICTLFSFVYNRYQLPEIPHKAPADYKIKYSEFLKDKWLMGVAAIYSCFGYGYMVYTTFFLDYLINEIQMEKMKAGVLFALGGLITIPSGYLLGYFSDKFGRMKTWAVSYLVQGTTLLLLAFIKDEVFLIIASVLICINTFGIPTIAMSTVDDKFDPHKATQAMAIATVCFGIGQFISPIFSGFILSYLQQYFYVFAFSGISFYIGAGICLWYILVLKEK